ncbi:Protein MCM10-like protein [Aphelenchoides bicaudatus]|nr:Protein MCM10-like protein [Aphelenchoides bicaudatus]
MILGNAKVERSNDSFPLENKDLTRQAINSSSKNATVFDPFFGIRIASPRFSLEIFNSYCNELTKTRIGSLTNSTSSNTIFMGVIVESSGMKKSANNKDYLIWHLSDLQSDQKVKLLIFGEAAQAHWKIQVGFVVAVTNAEVANDSGIQLSNNYSRVLTFKTMKSLQIMLLGLCPDFGICMGQRKNGERCTNYVNAAFSPVCVYHLQTEAKKLRSVRGSLSAISNERSKFTIAKSPQKPQHDGKLYTVSRPKTVQPSTSVNLFTGGRAEIAAKARIGQKQMNKLSEMIEKESNQQASTSSKPLTPKLIKAEASTNVLKEFINRQTTSDRIKQEALRVGAPKIDRPFKQESLINLANPQKVQQRSPFSPAELAARKRAAEIFKRSQTDPISRKRKVESSGTEPEKRDTLIGGSKITNDQIRQLLNKKSIHQKEIDQVDRDTELRYFQKREIEEKIENHATTLMEIKNVDVVTCKACDYTATHLAQRCLDLNHAHIRHKATRRFFKCKDCSTRTICYALMPTTPCTRCSCKDFVRVAMKDERKIPEKDKLLLRGEERKYVNI